MRRLRPWRFSETRAGPRGRRDRKSTRLNSSHLGISYAVFCFDDTLCLSSFPTRRSSDLVLAAQNEGAERLLAQIAALREACEGFVDGSGKRHGELALPAP